MKYLARIIENKRNKQLLIHLSKRKLAILKDRKAKFLKVNEEDLVF